MDRPQEVDPHSYRPPPAWGSLPTVEVCFHMGTCGGRPTLLTTRDYCSRDLSRQGFAMNLFVLRKLNLHQIPAVETAATKCTKPHLRGVPLGFEPAEAGFVNFVAVNLFARVSPGDVNLERNSPPLRLSTIQPAGSFLPRGLSSLKNSYR